MDMPTLTLREFFIASQITHAPRGRLRSCELGRAAGGMISRGGLQKILFVMEKRGFLRKTPGEPDSKGKRQTFLSLTRDGKAAAAEFADWVSCVAQGLGTESKPARLPASGREATPDERELMLAQASPEFRQFLRAVWAIPECTVKGLANADVGDWDPRGGVLTTIRGPVNVDDDGRAAIEEAVGFRTSGPIFKPARAKRFTRVASGEFQDLRERCGLSSEIRLRPRRAADPPAS